MKQGCIYNSPVGELWIEEEDGFLIRIERMRKERKYDSKTDPQPVTVLEKTCRELDEYFAGKRKSFDIPLKLSGTEFQKKAWEELQKIPYGETITYGEQARRLGNEKAVRAVGGANGRNPVLIMVPCHRVIGADGSLTGFAAGISVKAFLLELEKNN